MPHPVSISFSKVLSVNQAANLALFMVNFSYALLQPFREHNPEYSLLDLKSHYRGIRYAQETIDLLQKYFVIPSRARNPCDESLKFINAGMFRSAPLDL